MRFGCASDSAISTASKPKRQKEEDQMPNQKAAGVRALGLVGPTGAGKTTLLEAMLLATGTIEKRAGGDKVGDSSPEARARGHSVEINLAGFDFMGDHYAVV